MAAEPTGESPAVTVRHGRASDAVAIRHREADPTLAEVDAENPHGCSVAERSSE